MVSVKKAYGEIFTYLKDIADVDLDTRDGQNKTLEIVAR